MARDSSLTVPGLMVTRKSSFQGSRGLTQVETKQDYYEPHPALKAWVVKEKPFFLTGTDPRLVPRGLLLDGVPGCVAEGTLIGLRRGQHRSGQDRFLPIEVLFEKFSGTYTGRDPWRKKLTTFVQSWRAETGAVVYNRVEGVFDKGVKPCLRVVTRNSGEVILTHDHPVLNSEGVFVRADSLKVGSRVLVRGSMKPVSSGLSVRRLRVVVEGLKYYGGGWAKTVVCKKCDRTYDYRRQHRARLVVEAHLNGLSYDDFVETLKTDPVKSTTFALLPETVDVHHLDENPLNDTITNLQVLNRDEHFLLHNADTLPHLNVEHTRESMVVEVHDAGMRRTFDLSMDEPAANFVVNDGIIVHNTGKTAGSKWIAEQMGVPLYRVDIGGTKNKYVGQSEANLLSNFSRIDAEEPAIALLDEVEKVFLTKEGDGGTTTSMLSQMLWWLAEHKSRVLTIMTTNNSKALPRELYREGRIDAVMLFEGLDKDEAVAFVGNVLKTFGLEPQTNVTPVLKAAGLMTDFGIGKKVSQAALTEAVKNHVKKNGLSLHKG